MKKLVLTIALATVSVGVFAQGKLTLSAPNHPIRFSSNSSDLKPSDAALAGQYVTPGMFSITFLYKPEGSASPALPYVFASTPVINSAVGLLPGSAMNFNTANGQPYSVAGNSRATFDILLWQTAAGSYENALNSGGTYYYGFLRNISATTGSVAGSALDSAAAGSTWTTQNLVTQVPEPATASLLGLGLASLLIFRRRS